MFFLSILQKSSDKVAPGKLAHGRGVSSHGLTRDKSQKNYRGFQKRFHLKNEVVEYRLGDIPKPSRGNGGKYA